jgi:hypothetical protein
MSYIDFTVDELASVAAWARDHVPPTAKVLVHDAGYVAYATDLSLIDLVGLKSPASAEVHARVTWPSCGGRRVEAIHRIALAGHADYLIVLKGWERIFRIAHGLARRGWHVQPVRLVAEVGYDVYELTPPTSEAGPSRP